MADKRIQYTDRMTGANHPTLPDTLNQLTLVEHNTDGTHDTTKVAPASKGVTNGDTHNHTGGAGATLDHANLLNKGTNTHAQIDTALGRLANTSGTNTGDQDLSLFALKTTTVNSQPLSSNVTITTTTLGAVPTTRTVNSKALSSDITLTPSDIGSVPITRTVNGHALSTDVTVTASDIGAISNSTTVNGHPLTTNVTVTAADVGFTNQPTLLKITESGGSPLWNGAAWPGGGSGGDMYKAVYDPTSSGTVNSASYSKYVTGGVYSLGSYVDPVTGAITVQSGDYIMNTSADGSGTWGKYTIAGGTLSLTDLSLNYVVANYNSGIPQLQVLTDNSSINQTTIIPIYTVYRQGTFINVLDWKSMSLALANKICDRLVRTDRFVRESGLSLSEAAARLVEITSGYVWYGATRQSLPAFDSAANSMYLWYHVSSGWVNTSVTQYNNTQYDNGTDVFTLSNNNYAVNWVFKNVSASSNRVCLVLGTGDYTLAQAQSATIPNLPPQISSCSILIGKIIVQKGATAATEITSAFATSYSAAALSNHADLLNLDYASSGHTGFQASLVSGTDIKTVNGTSLLGSGDLGTINVAHGGTGATTLTGVLKGNGTGAFTAAVSGTDIKTVNGTSLLGSGDIAVQPTLVSGTNIKTINSTSILGEGNIVIEGGGADIPYQNDAPSNPSDGDLWIDKDAIASGGSATPHAFFKADFASAAFIKTAAETISVKADTFVLVGSTMVSWESTTAVVMPALTAGTDYAIYACTDGTCRADASFTAPTGYDTGNSRLIGGFHYGLVAAGTAVAGGSFATTGNGMIWTQADVDKIAGINQYSLWDLKWRPQCDPKGMALVAGRVWVDIYFCGTDHITNGTSRAGTDIASGTVLPKKPLEFGGNGTTTYATPTWWDFVEIVNAYKKRLIREQEFVLAAFGVTENQSIDAMQSTYPTTQRNAGYTSKYGIEQASGHHWTWGEDAGQYGETFSWQNANGGRGQVYMTSYNTRVILGGVRSGGAYSGSRCSVWSYSPWSVDWGFGVRAACDHLMLL